MAEILFGETINRRNPIAYVIGTTAYILRNASVTGNTATLPARVQNTTAIL